MLNLLAQVLRDFALADRNGEARSLRALGQALAAPGVECALDRPQQLRQRERLLDEIESAEPRRFDRGFDRPMSGHHDHRAVVAVGRRPFPQQGDAVRIGHPYVEQNQVGHLRRAGGARLGGVGRDVDLVALLGEDFLEQAADIRLVIHHQYSRSGHTRSLLCSPFRGSRPPTERAPSPNGSRIRTRAPPLR